MLLALVLALGLQESVGPALPAGCDTRFQAVCLRVEEALEKGDFAAAATLATGLPRPTIRLAWDDSAVPAAQRPDLVLARDRAIAAWKTAIPSLRVSLGQPADVSVALAESLPDRTKGAIHEIDAQGGTRVRTSLSLTRGAPPVAISAKDVQNEVAYAIGLHCGLAPSPLYSHIMGRTEQPNKLLARITPDEAAWARANLDAAEVLRAACREKRRLKPARSRLEVVGPEPSQTRALQGERPSYRLVLRNRGNVALHYRIASTCACLVTDAKERIEPSQEVAIVAKLDTTEFIGDLRKELYLYTNDPNRPIVEVPIRSVVTPRYRLIAPGGDVVLLEDQPVNFDVYLAIPPQAPLKPVAIWLDGIEGVIAKQTWHGSLADEALNEPARERSGYRLRVTLSPQDVFGRKPCALMVATDDEKFKTLQFSFSVQRGIVALPLVLYFGQLAHRQAEGAVLITRPSKPFRIVRIESDLPSLTATAQAVRGQWEHKVTVHYDGTGRPGPLKALFKVYTDDPKQPVVMFQVGGVIP